MRPFANFPGLRSTPQIFANMPAVQSPLNTNQKWLCWRGSRKRRHRRLRLGAPGRGDGIEGRGIAREIAEQHQLRGGQARRQDAARLAQCLVAFGGNLEALAGEPIGGAGPLHAETRQGRQVGEAQALRRLRFARRVAVVPRNGGVGHGFEVRTVL